MPQFSKATRSLLPRGAALLQRVDEGLPLATGVLVLRLSISLK